MLSDAYASGEPNPDIPLYSHHAKVAAAHTVLGSSSMWLSDPAFQTGAFQSDAFQMGVPADEPTRLEVTHVDYGSTGWRQPPTIEPTDLRVHIADALVRLEEWEKGLPR